MRVFNIPVLVFVMIIGAVTSTVAHENTLEKNNGIKVKPTIAFHGRVKYDTKFLRIKDEIGPCEDYKPNEQEYRRVYIKLTQFPITSGHITIGSFAEPTGLDMATSSKYSSFFERAMMTNAQNFRWNYGFMYDNYNLINGKLGLQTSYTFKWNHKTGFTDTHIEEGGHFVARLTNPICQSAYKFIHVGVNLEYRLTFNTSPSSLSVAG